VVDKENEDIATALEEALLTPPPSETESTIHVQIPTANSEGVDEFHDEEDPDERFQAFHVTRVQSALQGSIASAKEFGKRRLHKRALAPEPKTHRDLKGHQFESEFREAQRQHLQSHYQMKSWEAVPKHQTRGQRPLSSMWVFVYKTDKHGYLQKCKARLVVCGNQQAQGDLPTRADTLAGTTFRAMMAITAQFDLETRQLDAVNAFVNCRLDEVVFMRHPPGFEDETGQTVLRLKKALYGLRRSPLLWQRELTTAFRTMGFKELPQEPCVMIRDSVIAFFYVDDIVFCYKAKEKALVEEVVASLEKKFAMTHLGELKWFLGINVIRDRAKKTLWLSQEAYVEMIANKYGLNSTEDLQKAPDTPMSLEELLPNQNQASHASTHLYQKKVGSILFTAITTRPDIAFAVSRLSRFNQNPGEIHHKAADRVIRYLYHTKGRALRYGGEDARGMRSLVCASDASFGDNTIDRKSSQGYMMMLFGGPIAWRANKQDTVTTSSTEAELLALSQTAKEALFVSRLLRSMKLKLEEGLAIQCDNRQTIRLVTEDSMKLNTKLRHIDIHNHWLRQEHHAGRIRIEWIPTSEMPADGLTKALTHQRHEGFIKLIRLDDITEKLASLKRMEALKEQLMDQRKGQVVGTVHVAILATGKTKARRQLEQMPTLWQD
jgi:hypothetical protein